MGKTIIISNRLPVKILKSAKGELVYKPSEGGLATGLGSIYRKGNNVWLGWPGLSFKKDSDKTEVTQKLKSENMFPVFLTAEEIKLYYEGFSNETLWPTFHYFNQYAIYKKSLWEAYEKVNKKFCEALMEIAEPEDTIWVHDYQLLLLPGLIRQQMPNVSVGFFLHIPFPSYEVFRLLPWRKELIDGMLGADLVGFHTYDDMRHFLSAVSRISYLSNKRGQLTKGNRVIQVDSFPMGIDYDKYANSAASPETIKREVRFRASLGDQKLILSIDRLDYSKGIPARLGIFDIFLQNFPKYQKRVSLILIVVPSRDKVEKYKELKREVDLLVGRINGRYGTMNWTPIHYFYRSFPLEDLSAFYRMADVAMVTPMRDGMNLVCKEFVASKLDKKGVLVLSEMAGSSKELSDAIIINPNDKTQVVDALHQALTMPEEEQSLHMDTMQATLKRYNIHHWVKMFLDRLEDIKERQQSLATKRIDEETVQIIMDKYTKSKKRLFFLDYDGTLVPFYSRPEQASPGKELLEILTSLTENPNNHVVIISGRDRKTLGSWLGHLKMDMICEHGVWLRAHGEEWETIDSLSNEWKSDIKPILEMYVNKTPGSLVEEKDYSLAWHYRKVDPGFGDLRAREIVSHLKYLSANMNLQVLEGDMVVEIKNIEVNKGKAACKWMERYPSDFIMALGDDWTDEDTFKAIPKDGVTIKVGSANSEAKYSIENHTGVRDLLGLIAKNK